MNPAPPLRVIVAALVVFVVTVAAVVALVVASPALQAQLTSQLSSHAGAIGAALVAGLPALAAWLTGRKVRATQADHAVQLATISTQTNGVLDQRIRDGVRAELENAGLTVPDLSVPVVPTVVPDAIPAQPTGR